MNAVRLQVIIPENRELRLALPPEAPPGAAEVIVLIETAAPPPVGSWESIQQFLNRTPPVQLGRTKAEIDRYVEEERASWEHEE